MGDIFNDAMDDEDEGVDDEEVDATIDVEIGKIQSLYSTTATPQSTPL